MLTAVLEGWDTEEAGRTLGSGSLDGGSGASSAAELSPKGPSGSVESSTASSLVTCALTLRGPLGPRRTADREVVGALSCVAGWLGAAAGSEDPTFKASARRETYHSTPARIYHCGSQYATARAHLSACVFSDD